MKKLSDIKNIVLSKNYALPLLALGLILLLYLGARYFIPSFNFYKEIVELYAFTAGKGIEVMASISGIQVVYDSQTFNIATSEHSFNIVSHLAIKFYIIAFLMLYLFPRKLFKTTLYFLFAVLALFVISVSRYSIDINNNPEYKDFFLILIYASRYLILYILLSYKIKLHQTSDNLIVKIDSILKDKIHLSFLNLILFFIILRPALSFIDAFVANQSLFLAEKFTQMILWYATGILKISGYSVIVTGCQIELGNYWVYLGPPCLGLGVMTLFAVLISIIKSQTINKLIYILIGWQIIIMLNAVRVVAILLHIYLNQIPQQLIEDYHNMSNNYFYIVVLIMIVVYVRWFQNINFSKKAI